MCSTPCPKSQIRQVDGEHLILVPPTPSSACGPQKTVPRLRDVRGPENSRIFIPHDINVQKGRSHEREKRGNAARSVEGERIVESTDLSLVLNLVSGQRPAQNLNPRWGPWYAIASLRGTGRWRYPVNGRTRSWHRSAMSKWGRGW